MQLDDRATLAMVNLINDDFLTGDKHEIWEK